MHTTLGTTLHHLVYKRTKTSSSPYCISEVIVHKEHLQELSQHAVRVRPSCNVTHESQKSEQFE